MKIESTCDSQGGYADIYELVYTVSDLSFFISFSMTFIAGDSGVRNSPNTSYIESLGYLIV